VGTAWTRRTGAPLTAQKNCGTQVRGQLRWNADVTEEALATVEKINGQIATTNTSLWAKQTGFLNMLKEGERNACFLDFKPL